MRRLIWVFAGRTCPVTFSDVGVLLCYDNITLTLSILSKIFGRRHFEIYFLYFLYLKYISYFSQKTGFDISCKLSPKETICMKCQILFSGKNKKNINLSSAENSQRVVKVNMSLWMMFKYKSMTFPQQWNKNDIERNSGNYGHQNRLGQMNW